MRELQKQERRLIAVVKQIERIAKECRGK